jgi:nicotinate-nucleotide adenylyltransferase
MASRFDNPIGILGGSFDPVHLGHLRLAIESIDAAGLERVVLIPLFTPTHREGLIATPEQRFHMLKLATEQSPQLEVSDIEIRRRQPSYTIDTMRELRLQNPQQSISLIMGMDAFLDLDTWKEWQDMIDLCHIIVVERPGAKSDISKPKLAEIYESRKVSHADDLKSCKSGMILKINAPLLDISSSKIRKMLSLKQHIDFLVPEKVMDYILEEKIYLD